LASNLANADTPNYKARDFDFGTTLKNALGKLTSPSALIGAATTVATLPAQMATAPLTIAKSLLTTSAMHLGSSPSGNASLEGGVPESDVKYRTAAQGSVDGNTVDADVERNQFADNALRYEASLAILRSDIKDMQAVLQG
jgi:flagellar basal-body rod protein FlgB